MLLSSILSILDQYQNAQVQPKVTEKAEVQPFEISKASAADQATNLKEFQSAKAAEAGLLRPLLPDPPVFSPSLQELIRAVAKFEKKEPARVVDVFE